MASSNQPPKGDSEQARRKREEQARSTRRRTRQLIGVALAVLIVVGALSIIQGGVQMVQRLMDNTEEKEAFSARVEMMVVMDVLPFDSLEQADENVLKQVVLWSVFYRDLDTIARNEEGAPLIPSIEADLYATELFGPSFRFREHGPFYEPVQAMDYTYDEETRMYTLPITSIQPSFVPSVADIVQESGGIKRVIVGYVNAQSSQGEVITNYDYEHPARYMEYIFKRDGNEYYLSALLRSDRQPPAPASSSQPAPSQEASSLPEDDDAGVASLPAVSSSVPASSSASAASTP